jgi:hypothetical protein
MKKLMSHQAANYRASTTERRRCGTCSMFTAGKTPGEASCSLVARPIRPSGVCDFFEAKGGVRAASQ